MADSSPVKDGQTPMASTSAPTPIQNNTVPATDVHPFLHPDIMRTLAAKMTPEQAKGFLSAIIQLGRSHFNDAIKQQLQLYPDQEPALLLQVLVAQTTAIAATLRIPIQFFQFVLNLFKIQLVNQQKQRAEQAAAAANAAAAAGNVPAAATTAPAVTNTPQQNTEPSAPLAMMNGTGTLTNNGILSGTPFAPPVDESSLPRKPDGSIDHEAAAESNYIQMTNDKTVFNDPGPQPWPSSSAPKPTLTGGLIAGLQQGTPALIKPPQDDAALFFGDFRHSSLRKTSGAEAHLRRRIQDLVTIIDPEVKVDSEAENLLLEIADEFIDSVTNFACRLAKHRGGDTLEIRDLQLHLDVNHNIRIPGFSSDAPTQISPSNNPVPTSQGNAAPNPNKKSGGGGAGAASSARDRDGGPNAAPKRSARLAAVQQAKRDNRLV